MKGPAWDVCFTGHRPQALGGYDPDSPVNRHVRGLLRASLEILHGQGFRSFVSGMAQGVDQWAAQEVLDLKSCDASVRLIAAVPFEGQDALWPAPARKAYADLVEKADEVHLVAPGPYAPWKMMVRNEWMVDRSRVVLAVWDGRDHGGTASCVSYAMRKGARVLRLDPHAWRGS